MPLHLGLSGHSQQESAREARRMLQDKVKNTWDYPSAPHPDTHTPSSLDAKAVVTAAVGHSETTARNTTLDFEPTAWREREYSDVDSPASTEDEGAIAGAAVGGVGAGGSSNYNKARRSNADTDGSTERARRIRKRKRADEFEEEMTWNVGLAHFSAQRNAWTGARIGAATSTSSTECIPLTTGAAAFSSNMEADPTHNYGQLAVAEDANVALPMCPKLLPDHPVRSRISNQTYSEIYSKIILQGRTPTVPINLQDVTNALIHGWKEEGNWPPKNTEPEPSAVGKKSAAESGSTKHPHLTRGVKVVTKVFQGLTGGPMDGVQKQKG